MRFEWFRRTSGYFVCRVGGKKLVRELLNIDDVETELRKSLSARKKAPWEGHLHEWRITDGSVFGKPNREVVTYLVDDPQLFREFAEMDPTLPGMLRFANKYGLLQCRHIIEDFVKKPSGEHLRAERLTDWMRQIYLMKWALKAWELARREDYMTLGPCIRLDDRNDKLEYVGGEVVSDKAGFALANRQVIADRTTHKDVLARFRANQDPIEPTFVYVGQAIDRGLLSLDVGGTVLEAPGAEVKRKYVVIETRWDPQRRRFHMELQPDNLIGALWLQFHEAVTGGKSFAACMGPGCGKIMEVGSRAGGKRTKQYCSPACRARASRQRSEEGSSSTASGS